MNVRNLVEKGARSFVSRRFFIGGAGAFGAFGAMGGARLFAAPVGAFTDGKPNLTLGVVSDIHLAGPRCNNAVRFRQTLEWFRDQGVDAVMVTGDLADTGLVSQLQGAADAWYSVFPNDRAPDGRKVEKLFLLGNHDYHGYLYGDAAKKRFAKEQAAGYAGDYAAWSRANVLRSDIPRWWKKIFREDYSRFYRKEINGYTFLGRHWDDGTDMSTGYSGWDFGAEIESFLKTDGGTLDPKRPFFYFQHQPPKDTCYGPWASGHDSGISTKALSAFPNAVAFSGHSHYALTDERSIWQGDFTSLGASSLYYTHLPLASRLPLGYENSSAVGKKAAEFDALKVMNEFNGGGCHQGMLWRIYDDHAVIRRLEFPGNVALGADWIMPLGTGAAKPFAFARRKARAKAPQFPADAAITIKAAKAKTRATKTVPQVEKASWEILFPQAFAEPESRPFEYEIAAEGGGARTTFHVLAEGFNHALGWAKTKRLGRCVLAQDRLPAGTTHLTVTPLDCWWNRGRALKAALG